MNDSLQCQIADYLENKFEVPLERYEYEEVADSLLDIVLQYLRVEGESEYSVTLSDLLGEDNG